MTLRVVPIALLLGTAAAVAFDTSRLNKALLESNKKKEEVRCLGMRFPGQWKNLGGLRVSPYTCDFGAK